MKVSDLSQKEKLRTTIFKKFPLNLIQLEMSFQQSGSILRDQLYPFSSNKYSFFSTYFTDKLLSKSGFTLGLTILKHKLETLRKL